MRVYLVVIDESQEAHGALRFAARRAVDTGGAVHLLALVPKQDFSAFGAIQATIEEEARDRAEVLANSAATSGCSARYSSITPKWRRWCSERPRKEIPARW